MSPTRDQAITANTSRRRFLEAGAATLACLSLPPNLFAATAETIVSTPSGKLRGELLAGSRTSPAIRIFRGVPFAEPPVGPLRFRAAVPPKPWKGIRAATSFAAAPFQPNQPKIPQSEDCLALNIWAPAGRGPFPVFVWIHGGGYTGGQSFAPIFDGAVFAQQGIVVVTIAYRLGVFGFMDLAPLLGPAYADSANNALRDLTAALEWVHVNISAFGGDPSRVTVGGQSAGAKATAALMAIPQASRLFHSAISESGGGERVLTPEQAIDVSHTYGSLWRGAHPQATASFSDLLTGDPADLIAIQTSLIASSNLHFPFRPETGSSFLAKRPTDLIAASASAGKRLLIGTNRDESASFIGPHPDEDPTGKDLGNLDLPRFKQVFAQYAALYPDMPESQRRIRAVTAEEYWVPSTRLADAFARTGGDTWMYRFDYTELSGPQANEAHHSLELGLVWEKLDRIEAVDPTALPLSQQLHQAWVSFIQGQPPAATGLPTWTSYNADTRPTMIFSAKSHMEDKPNNTELQLWSSVL